MSAARATVAVANATRKAKARAALCCTALGVEDDDVAGDAAGLERGEALVDLREADPRRHHLGQMQPALQVELDQPRHVGAEAVRSHHAALDAALAQEVDAVQLDLRADRDHAD